MIVRDKRHHWFIPVDRRVVEDKSVSWAAVGLWVAIEIQGTQPVDVEALAGQRGDVAELIDELVAAGYLISEKEE